MIGACFAGLCLYCSLTGNIWHDLTSGQMWPLNPALMKNGEWMEKGVLCATDDDYAIVRDGRDYCAEGQTTIIACKGEHYP